MAKAAKTKTTAKSATKSAAKSVADAATDTKDGPDRDLAVAPADTQNTEVVTRTLSARLDLEDMEAIIAELA